MQRSSVVDNFLGCFLIVAFSSFLGLIYYASEAYPKISAIENLDPDRGGRAKITLLLGNLCDPPAKLIADFEKANPKIQIESYHLSHRWNGDQALELRLKKK